MFVTNWISTTKIQKISEITNFFRHYFLSRTEVSTIQNVITYIWIPGHPALDVVCYFKRMMFSELAGISTVAPFFSVVT